MEDILIILNTAIKITHIQMCFISHFNISKNIIILKCAGRLTYLKWTKFWHLGTYIFDEQYWYSALVWLCLFNSGTTAACFHWLKIAQVCLWPQYICTCSVKCQIKFIHICSPHGLRLVCAPTTDSLTSWKHHIRARMNASFLTLRLEMQEFIRCY